MHLVAANGAEIPAIGQGTWTLKGAEAARLVASAIKVGYRHIDTAAMYENEEAVGEGLRISGVPRSEIFVTTKVWPTDIAAGDLQKSIEASLARLKLDNLDLALIHWPSRSVALAESIAALNEVKDRGMARHIGVSNFTVPLIEQAVALSRHPLVCNQIENHPYLNQDRVIAACHKHGLAVVSYCPLARGSALFSEPAVAGPAALLGRTPAQVVLRWHVQQEGVVAIPRSSDPGRIAQNLDVFGFELEPDEMAAISALRAKHSRICDFEFSPDWDPV
jgi:diketogulonate reductase-like aldo/keto reductase